MSEASYLEDGSEYYDIYSGDCDMDCRNCEHRIDCDDVSL